MHKFPYFYKIKYQYNINNILIKYKIFEYAKLNKVTYRTVWLWLKSGKVKSEITTTGRILVVDNELRKDEPNARPSNLLKNYKNNHVSYPHNPHKTKSQAL